MTSKLVDLSEISTEQELEIMDHSLGIMNNLVKQYNDPSILKTLSIDKTENVLSIVDHAVKTSKTMMDMRLKVKTATSESNDRARLMSILTTMSANDSIIDADREIVLDDTHTEVGLVRGELAGGIEQLSMELLELEKEEQSNDDELA